MSEVFLTDHNVTIYSLNLLPPTILHSPLHCKSVASPGVHFFTIVVACSFIGSLGNHSSWHKAARCLLLACSLPHGHWQ